MDERKVVTEFLIPGVLCEGLPTGKRLQVMKRQGNADLDFGMNRLDGFLGRLMSAEYQGIALRGTGGNENLRLRGAENGGIFLGGVFHVFHHLLKIHAHLHRAFRFLRVFLGLLGHHLKTFGDGRQLQTHIGLVDGADVFDFIASQPPFWISHTGLVKCISVTMGSTPFSRQQRITFR